MRCRLGAVSRSDGSVLIRPVRSSQPKKVRSEAEVRAMVARAAPRRESTPSQAGGHASALLVPFLDNQVTFANQLDPETGKPKARVELDLDTAVRLVKDAFTGAAERQIQVGDTLEILVLTKEGPKILTHPLRRD